MKLYNCPPFDPYDFLADALKIHHFPESTAHVVCAMIPPLTAAFELTASLSATLALTLASEKIGVPFPPVLRGLVLCVSSAYSIYSGLSVGAQLANRVSAKIEEANRQLLPLLASQRRATKRGAAPASTGRFYECSARIRQQ